MTIQLFNLLKTGNGTAQPRFQLHVSAAMRSPKDQSLHHKSNPSNKSRAASLEFAGNDKAIMVGDQRDALQASLSIPH
jgi:hypothetical protein